MNSTYPLVTCVLFIFSAALIAQDVEDLPSQNIHDQARFYVEQSGLAKNCLEGFRRSVSGSVMTYHSARSDVNEALIVRAQDGEQRSIQWLGARVPAGFTGPTVTFAWLAGLGCNLGNEAFDLRLNGRQMARFSLSDKTRWQVTGEDGAMLSFMATRKDEHGDLFGYLFLQVPLSELPPDRENLFEVQGGGGESMAWFMTFIHPQTVRDFTEAERSGFWYRLSLESGTLAMPSNWVGGKLEIRDQGSFVAEVLLTRGRLGSEARFACSEMLNYPLEIRLNGRLIDQLKAFQEARFFNEQSCLVVREWKDGGKTLECSALRINGFAEDLAAVGESRLAQGTVHVVNSSHQDVAWMDTPQQCEEDRDRLVLTPALERLQRQPDYFYSVEDTLCLKEYLGRHPDKMAEIRDLTLQGRLEWGATYTQPYESLCSGEGLVRQIYFGRKWLRKTLEGCDTRIAWNVDVPARAMQMPQILKKSGVEYLVISRHEKGFFQWQSPDGSHVNVFSPGHYHEDSRFILGDFQDSAPKSAAFIKSWAEIYEAREWPAQLPVLLSTDMAAPVDLKGLIPGWNKMGAGPEFRFNTGEGALKAFFDKAENLPILRGERPNVWLYIHGPTHHKAISAAREAAVLLPAAEKFSAILGLIKGDWQDYPGETLTRAWEDLSYPDHGWGGKNGAVTDRIFLEKYTGARDAGERLLMQAQEEIACRISHPEGMGIPVTVFNALSWERSDPVRFPFDFAAGEAHSLSITTAEGLTVPLQFIESQRHEDGSLRTGKAVFVAEKVPSLGYKTFYLIPGGPEEAPSMDPGKKVDRWENGFYAIEFSPGGIRRIFDKSLEVSLLDTRTLLGGEVFSLQSEGHGAGEFAEVQQPTLEKFDRLANKPAHWRCMADGPVFARFQMEHPFDHTRVKQNLFLYKTIKRLDIETSLKNWDGEKNREYRLAFPIRMAKGQVTYEVPFGSLEIGKDEISGAAGERYIQPAKEVHPREVQDWISISDDRFGITLSSDTAVWDHVDPFANQSHTMLQPLLLASRKSCHGEGNWYLQPGDHDFRQSLFSHTPGWQQGYRLAKQVNDPLRARVNTTGRVRGGSLPPTDCFFSVNVDHLLISTVKKCEDNDRLVIRLYESEKKPARGALFSAFKIKNAWHTDLIEEQALPTPFEEDHLPLDLGACAVETFAVEIDL